MAIPFCSVETDEKQQEQTAHGDMAFPVACYVDDLTEAVIPWHWHEELEVAIVVEGTAVVAAGARQFTVTPGQVVFTNAGVLHGDWNAGTGPCRIHAVVFHPLLVSGTRNSVLWQKYLGPLLENRNLEGVLLDGSEVWHQQAAAAAQTAFDAFEQEAAGFEFSVREALSRLIFLIVSHTGPLPSRASDRAQRDSVRIKQMLQYIHTHYAEEIRVEQIARSAAISVSECLRCFRGTIGVTPVQYLRQYRVQQAAELLRRTEWKIAEIGACCGFQEMSYFARTFQLVMGCSPSAYRKQLSA